jgi:replication-associated recombination protein RarA
VEKLSTKEEKYENFVQNIIKNKKISHAYIIELCDYESDMTLVNAFIKLILCKYGCTSFDALNCGKCNVCKLVDDFNYPDVRYIEPDGKEIKKNQLLEIIRDYGNKSMLDNKRIYVIKEADKMNLFASNTLLKFLEEPVDDVIAILLTTNRYKIIDTVLSRCQILTIGTDRFDSVFNENMNKLITYILNGNRLFTNYNEILSILPTKLEAFSYFMHIQNVFLLYLQTDITLYQSLEDASKKQVMSDLKIIQKGLKELEYNVNYKLWLDSMFAKLIGGGSND